MLSMRTGEAVIQQLRTPQMLTKGTGPYSTVSASGSAAEPLCALTTDGRAVCWGYNLYGQANAPSGTMGSP